ncbi:hypothetical protein F3Y22_tig00112107pilonHSYRG00005 [Hibiscus syriacus]|uniref:Uncharacterized protein n=1 Tax=Hibiscus syriacus TaxID=106335 RepID=A0A6A2YCJ3_HIBSY|nr:hypothetical protein F3Y22_tig00112107pilonHSYRG00005 [Hibiscus syriacus]
MLLLGLKCRSKVEGVETDTRASTFICGQAVLLEDEVLVHASRFLMSCHRLISTWWTKMNSITKRVDDEAKYSDFPALYH